ncbi:hypothetical protein [Plesiomonas shigelloides]|nr:hypothetical protein [Plesiomonas shigelloides]
MSITIPTWLLWMLGIPLGLIVLGAAALGVYFFIGLAKAGRS